MTYYIKWLSIGLDFQICVPSCDISELLELVNAAVVNTHLMTQEYYIGRLAMWQCSNPLVGDVTEWLNYAQKTI